MELFAEFSILYRLLPVFSNFENLFSLNPMLGVGLDILIYVLGDVEFST